MMHRETLKAVRREWANDWLSVKAFAGHHHLTETQALALIELAQAVDDVPNPHY